MIFYKIKGHSYTESNKNGHSLESFHELIFVFFYNPYRNNFYEYSQYKLSFLFCIF